MDQEQAVIHESLSYSVIIVSYLRHAFLFDTLQMLSPLIDLEFGEIIVIDQCPPSPLPADILEIPGLRYISLDSPGMVNARNVGLRIARGRIVLYIDDDVIPTSELITSHVGAYTKSVVGGIAGCILDPDQEDISRPNSKVFSAVDGWRYAHFDHDIPGKVMTSRGCNMSFRRDVLVQLGGFDPNLLIFRDDSDMCLRAIHAGYEIWFVPTARLVHLNAPSGGTRETRDATARYWEKELRMYRQHHRHYRDNLYFISRHFHGFDRLKWVVDAYINYVGISRWPWRLVAKNACFLAALFQATLLARRRRRQPCSLP